MLGSTEQLEDELDKLEKQYFADIKIIVAKYVCRATELKKKV